MLKDDNSILRVLEIQGDRVLTIDCIKRTMPVLVALIGLKSYSKCTGNELFEVTGVHSVDMDTLDSSQWKIMHERYFETTRSNSPAQCGRGIGAEF